MAEVNSERLDYLVSGFLQHHAQLADNQWLQFQLKKHQFMRMAALASAGQAKGGGPTREEQAAFLQRALDLAKRELAPLALDAYVEAFAEFKRCMLALVSGTAASGSGRGEASEGSSGATCSGASSELEEFAGMVVRAVRQERPAAALLDGGGLVQLLRYLLLLHEHQHRTGFHPYWWPSMAPASQSLCERLLLRQRDALPPPALADALQGLHAGAVRETDVQALRTSLGCDREEAVGMLRRARGDAMRALQDALQAAHLDEGLLLELAEEYAISRGFDVPAAATEEQQQRQGPAAAQAGGDEAMLIDGQQGVAAAGTERCSLQQQQPAKQARTEAAGHEQITAMAFKATEQAAMGRQGAGADDAGWALELPAEMSEQQLRRVMRQLECHLAAGRAEAVLSQLETADPSFLADHPAAAFALHRCRFLHQLVPPEPGSGGSSSAGGTAAALAVVRKDLSPLAQQHPDLLQQQLKATLALLLPLSASSASDTAAAALKQHQQGVADALAAVRAALRPRCHLREPRLLCLLRELLSLHAAHFKLQRCQDRFAADLGISGLKAATGAAASTSAAAADIAVEAGEALEAAARQQLRQGGEVPVPGVRLVVSDPEDEDMEDEDSEEEDGEDDGEEGVGVPEQAILTVCEFTGLPRHTAIELLLIHGGDAAAVLAHVFP